MTKYYEHWYTSFQKKIYLAIFFDFTVTLYDDKNVMNIISSVIKKLSDAGQILIETWDYNFLKETNCMNYQREFKTQSGDFVNGSLCDFEINAIVFKRKFKSKTSNSFVNIKDQVQYLYNESYWNNLAKDMNLKINIVSNDDISQYVILTK